MESDWGIFFAITFQLTESLDLNCAPLYQSKVQMGQFVRALAGN